MTVVAVAVVFHSCMPSVTLALVLLEEEVVVEEEEEERTGYPLECWWTWRLSLLAVSVLASALKLATAVATCLGVVVVPFSVCGSPCLCSSPSLRTACHLAPG